MAPQERRVKARPRELEESPMEEGDLERFGRWLAHALMAGPWLGSPRMAGSLARTPPIGLPIRGDRGHLATAPLNGLAEEQHPASPCETGCSLIPIQHKSVAYLPKQIRQALLRIFQKIASADLALPIGARSDPELIQ